MTQLVTTRAAVTAPAFENYPHLWAVTDKRPGRRRAWKPVVTVENVRWVRPQLHVYRDKLYGSSLWWFRCDACVSEHAPRAYGLEYTQKLALTAALCHARFTHGEVI